MPIKEKKFLFNSLSFIVFNPNKNLDSVHIGKELDCIAFASPLR